MSQPQRRARLIDVAERSGVAKSVASRVLSGDPTLRTRPETRERILRTAEELGYHPHAGARALALSRAGVLALLIPDMSNPVYAAITRGAYRRARDLDFSLLLAEDSPDEDGEDFTDLVLDGRVDGLLVASARVGHPLVARLLEEPALVAHVFVNRTVPGSSRNVGLDMASASAAAVDHLVAHGHHRIAMVSGPPDLSPAKERLDGFRSRMADLALPAGPVAIGRFSGEGGFSATTELLTEHPDITALYTSTFVQAVGALRATREAGLTVPTDLSLITYDDSPLADYLHPRPTTISMPLAELGAAAVDALVAQLTSGQSHSVRVEDGLRIIERDSVGEPRPSPARER